MKNKITLLNVISALVLQVITIISGFIIPKIILYYFGSNVNGLISSLNQFLGYIVIIEGGITGVVMANLYKPLYDKDMEKVSSIIKTTERFYKRIGLIFIIYTFVLAFIYPLLFKTDFSYSYVCTLTFVLSISLFIQYMFSLTLMNLLNADKKVYIVSITKSIITILSIIFVIISVKIYPNVHVLKLLTGILFIIQPLVFNSYVEKNYKINKNAKENKSILKSRWNGFAINIAAFIHNGTDVAILTIFTNLSTVSIYSVYALVSSGLKQIIQSISSGISPTIGQTIANGNKEELHEKMNLYEYIILLLVYFLFTIAGLLITPFVMIYTKDITDANYCQPLFGMLLIVSEALYLIKLPHLSLAYNSNKFKEITKPAFIEAGLNIIVSIILISKFGLIGVAIGTLVAMTYRLIFHIYYTSKIIESRKPIIYYKKIIIFSIATLIGILICTNYISNVQYTVLSWIVHAVIYSIIFVVIYLVTSLIFFKNELKILKKYLLRK